MKKVQYKLSRGVKKYIRRQKALLRQRITDVTQLEQEMQKLYEPYKKELSKKSKN